MKQKQDLLKKMAQLSADEKLREFQIEELETRLEMASAAAGIDGTKTDAGDNGTCNGTCTNNGCNDSCW